MVTNYQTLEIDRTSKKEYTEQVLRCLSEWFGNEESLVNYLKSVNRYPFLSTFKNEACIGFFTRINHHEQTVDIHNAQMRIVYQKVGTKEFYTNLNTWHELNPFFNMVKYIEGIA